MRVISKWVSRPSRTLSPLAASSWGPYRTGCPPRPKIKDSYAHLQPLPGKEKRAVLASGKIAFSCCYASAKNSSADHEAAISNPEVPFRITLFLSLVRGLRCPCVARYSASTTRRRCAASRSSCSRWTFWRTSSFVAVTDAPLTQPWIAGVGVGGPILCATKSA